MSTITRMETATRMSKTVIHNNTVYLCGQVADNSDKGAGPQTENMLAKVDTLLEKAGSSREHMLSATIYLRDMKDFTEMNNVWDAWVPEGCAPARACVEARLARPDLLVEISVIAAIRE
ncbi:RutC family protein yoaB [Desulfamplus magnetovallimortis]|uniref:RutC family protein yoaB n=1 Tax=Desulfamplus magnetovallimortis TaxID=1246637 RepID=A0A1W1HAR5_9BACT|nr:RidA family protein [Desulfamplus magnetovallimortis]SLM29468.1 RutC family protein yoaB [Desulfamplus magnetovallimortis]